jgi:hypothetical protein
MKTKNKLSKERNEKEEDYMVNNTSLSLMTGNHKLI